MFGSCPYCHFNGREHGKFIGKGEDNGITYHTALGYEDGGFVILTYVMGYENATCSAGYINYCPICGRDLDD